VFGLDENRLKELSEKEACTILTDFARKARIGENQHDLDVEDPADFKRAQLMVDSLAECFGVPVFDSAGICRLYRVLLEYPFMSGLAKWRRDAFEKVQAHESDYVRENPGMRVPAHNLRVLVEQYAKYEAQVGSARARCLYESSAPNDFLSRVRANIPSNPLMNISIYQAYGILTSRLSDDKARRCALIMWREANEWYARCRANPCILLAREKAENRLREEKVF